MLKYRIGGEGDLLLIPFSDPLRDFFPDISLSHPPQLKSIKIPHLINPYSFYPLMTFSDVCLCDLYSLLSR